MNICNIKVKLSTLFESI